MNLSELNNLDLGKKYLQLKVSDIRLPAVIEEIESRKEKGAWDILFRHTREGEINLRDNRHYIREQVSLFQIRGFQIQE